VNGLGSTDCTDEEGNPLPDCPNGLGNLIVGYNEERGFGQDMRTGSHNVVVGTEHNFSRFGGIVGGFHNEISGDFAVVSGGIGNTASGDYASVSGGACNIAGDLPAGRVPDCPTVEDSPDGAVNTVSGGFRNMASGFASSVSGGLFNTASARQSSVSGGLFNTASSISSSVSGGLFNTASGHGSSVSGGSVNRASGDYATVSGGSDRSAPEENNWAAGNLLEAH
jgi:hypothetical protein